MLRLERILRLWSGTAVTRPCLNDANEVLPAVECGEVVKALIVRG